jgi:putative tryptophan/tyrosine transport system substrate-binding protein
VAAILKGKKPEQMPTRFMTKASDVDLLINLDVAKKLGLTVPADLVKTANKVVQNGKVVMKK